MNSHYHHSLEDAPRWWPAAESTTPFATLLLSILTGAFVLFKSLEILGYPVWLWLHQAIHMSIGVLRLRGAPLEAAVSEGSESTMQRGGGMLSSIFGLNSESLLHKGVRGLTGALSSGPSHVPPGLGNISNSCYQNSVIQGLAALPSLRNHLSLMAAEHPSLTTDTTSGALHELISKLNNPDSRGQNFWIRGKLKSMSTFTQQDAQEYYSKILDELDKEAKKATSSKTRCSVSWLEATKTLSDLRAAGGKGGQHSKDEAEKTPSLAAAEQHKMAPNPLDGLIAQRVGCTSCGYSEGLSLIPFNCITVSLGNNNSYDLRDCLDEYTKLEYIDGVECAKCTLLKLQKTLAPLAAAKPASPFEEKLNAVSEMVDDEKFDDNTLVKTLNIAKKNWVQSSKSKQIVVARAPKSLVLHVNRSIFDEMTGAQYKNSATVSYPQILDMGSWCLGSSPSGSGQPDMSLEEWPRDPKQSMLPHPKGLPTVPSSFQYRLRAAVTHFGSHGNGHYICYRPHPRMRLEDQQKDQPEDQQEDSADEQWWRFSDDSVYAVPEEQSHQANVFMLFYERIDEPRCSLQPRPDSLAENAAVAEPAPLPPTDFEPMEDHMLEDEIALAVPLPDDIDDFTNSPEAPATHEHKPAVAVAHAGAPVYSTPPPATLPQSSADSTAEELEADVSEAESEDEHSMQLASDPEAQPSSLPVQRSFTPISPHLMRTAGNAAARGQESRQSLPLVSAT
ncbi:cysteine proteinase [Setomelanomma holmii]|uniref:ubiquitinyl hydrolase 1 n=1 Tax=Setomelanomma holmii TaxID=210430 RepID=A0A9P4GXW4_9PLEO|nr:cysteine proteinase [Setomelanomma holmii]